MFENGILKKTYLVKVNFTLDITVSPTNVIIAHKCNKRKKYETNYTFILTTFWGRHDSIIK